MDFFNQQDFDFFSSLRRQAYNNRDEIHLRNSEKLKTDSVFTKTAHWAKLIEMRGYEVEISRKWQNSGYYREYTWAKIMLPAAHAGKVYFTIGVGSRSTNNHSYVNTLDFKLDCERWNKNALAPSAVSDFDRYIKENCPAAARFYLDIDQIAELNWETLVEKTISFIDCYREHYYQLIELCELRPAQKIARICWNENNWSKPSGPFGKSKSTDATFERDKGYGYEEWLFHTGRNLNGYHYSFIQAFNKGEHQGKNYTLNVYAIKRINNTLSEYYWIGKFNQIEVLTADQQQYALEEFEKRGWLNEMITDLAHHRIPGFDYGPVEREKIFNIRYHLSSENFIRFPEPVKIEDPVAEIGKNRHYVCLEKTSLLSIDELPIGKFTFKQGHRPGKTGKTKGKRKTDEFSISLIHKEIQEGIYKQFCAESQGSEIQIGTENATGFGTSIDLVRYCPKEGYSFFEIKTYGSVRSCIREAIGQLFEYNFYSENNYASKLIIVGLNPPTKLEKAYLAHLRKSLPDINLHYQVYSRTENQLLHELH